MAKEEINEEVNTTPPTPSSPNTSMALASMSRSGYSGEDRFMVL